MSRHRDHRPGRSPSRPPRPARGDGSAPDRVSIHGIHAVGAVLANPARTILSLSLSDNAAQRLAPEIERRKLAVRVVKPDELDRTLGRDCVHQGAHVEALPLPEPSLEELVRPRRGGAAPLVVVLDQVSDPHNVGAILRSAAVFGASGLVMTRHHSPPLEGALAKAASGALELVPVASVPNLARALRELADLGLTRIGLEGTGEAALEAEDLGGPLALVLGAEEKGLRRLTREHCDRVRRITTAGSIASLNVSNAAAIALHAAVTGRSR